ncbi:MAG TPA: hypothetical protein VFW85_03865 [Gaiellaceae bacterium]|nr:hypothetical protein [Gaiellaceae bacterium]
MRLALALFAVGLCAIGSAAALAFGAVKDAPAGTVTVQDAVGDANGGPDVSALTGTVTADGSLTLAATLANRSALQANESLQFFLRTDGGGQLDAAFFADGASFLERWNGSSYVTVDSVHGSWSGNTFSTTLSLAKLQGDVQQPVTPELGIAVGMYANLATNPTVSDLAPDSGYSMLATAPTTSTSSTTTTAEPPGFSGSTNVTITANSDGTYTATCTGSGCQVSYTGPGKVTVNFAGDNTGSTVYLHDGSSAVVTGTGADNVTLVDYTGKGGVRQSTRRQDGIGCVQTLNVGAGNNNVHVSGPCEHVVISGRGNSTIRVYGGTNIVNALGPGHSNVHATGGKGTIQVGKGGSVVFTTKASKYTIKVANGSKDLVNCGGAKDTVIYDKGADRLIGCGAAVKRPSKSK